MQKQLKVKLIKIFLMDVVNVLKNGGIAGIPTDTIYGIVGSALNSQTVEKIYRLRKRNLDKPFIILIGSIKDLEKFGIQLTPKQQDFLSRYWPNPLSVVLPVGNKKFNYLHRGKKSLAFRMPKNNKLIELLNKVGPLVAPSANIEGGKPAENIEEVKKYFGDSIDYYVDEGRINGNPSTLIKLEKDGSYKILRKGRFQF